MMDRVDAATKRLFVQRGGSDGVHVNERSGSVATPRTVQAVRLAAMRASTKVGNTMIMTTEFT